MNWTYSIPSSLPTTWSSSCLAWSSRYPGFLNSSPCTSWHTHAPAMIQCMLFPNTPPLLSNLLVVSRMVFSFCLPFEDPFPLSRTTSNAINSKFPSRNPWLIDYNGPHSALLWLRSSFLSCLPHPPQIPPWVPRQGLIHYFILSMDQWLTCAGHCRWGMSIFFRCTKIDFYIIIYKWLPVIPFF